MKQTGHCANKSQFLEIWKWNFSNYVGIKESEIQFCKFQKVPSLMKFYRHKTKSFLFFPPKSEIDAGIR